MFWKIFGVDWLLLDFGSNTIVRKTEYR